MRVRPAGPACHTGSLSCFAPDAVAHDLRAGQGPPRGLVHGTKLLDEGIPAVARKVGEEAVEVVTAALAETDERVVSEAADLSTTCTSCSPRAGSTSPRSRTSSPPALAETPPRASRRPWNVRPRSCALGNAR